MPSFPHLDLHAYDNIPDAKAAVRDFLQQYENILGNYDMLVIITGPGQNSTSTGSLRSAVLEYLISLGYYAYVDYNTNPGRIMVKNKTTSCRLESASSYQSCGYQENNEGGSFPWKLISVLATVAIGGILYFVVTKQ